MIFMKWPCLIVRNGKIMYNRIKKIGMMIGSRSANVSQLKVPFSQKTPVKSIFSQSQSGPLSVETQTPP